MAAAVRGAAATAARGGATGGGAGAGGAFTCSGGAGGAAWPAGAGSSFWARVGSTKRRPPRLTISGLCSQPVSNSAETTSRCRRREPATAPARYRPGRSSGRRSSPHAQRGCAASKTRILSIISQVAALHRSGRGGHGAAVDHDFRARDERGIIGREEERAAGDVLRLSYPAQRDPVPVPCRPFDTLDDVGGEPSP